MQQFVSVSEAARSLNVHNMTIYRMLRRGEIPGAIRLGRSIRIPEHWLKDFPSYSPRAQDEGE